MATPESWYGEAERLRRIYLDPKPVRTHPTERMCCGGWRNCQKCIRFCECLKDD